MKCKTALVILLATLVAFFAARADVASATPLPFINVQDFWDGDQTQFLQVAAALQDALDNGSVFEDSPSFPVGSQTTLTGWDNAVTGTNFTMAQADQGLQLATVADEGTAAVPLATDGGLAITGSLAGAGLVTAGAGLLPVGYIFLAPYINKTIYNWLHTDSSLGTATNFYPTWTQVTSAVSASGFPTLGSGSTYPAPVWALYCGNSVHSQFCNAGPGGTSVMYTYCVPDVAHGGNQTTTNYNTCEGTPGVPSSAIDVVMWNWLVAQATACTGGTSCADYPHIVYDTSTTNACNNDPSIGGCYELVRLPSQMKMATTITPETTCTGTIYCVDNSGVKVTPSVMTPQAITSLLEYLDAIARSGAQQAAAAEAALAALAIIANPLYQGPGTGTATSPTSTPWTVRMLPLPEEGETPAAYIDRVRTLGWIGTATITDDTTYEAALLGSGLCATTCDYLNQPLGSISSLSLTGTTPTLFPTYDTSGAYDPPLTEPKLGSATTPIHIYVKPLTSSFPPGSSTGPTIGSIDWSPIESLDLGSKFPFGAASYVPSLGDGAETCPSLTLTKPSVIGGGTYDLSFCSTTWETDYRPWIFPLAEAIMTIAVLMYLAFKIFGTGEDN